MTCMYRKRSPPELPEYEQPNVKRPCLDLAEFTNDPGPAELFRDVQATSTPMSEASAVSEGVADQVGDDTIRFDVRSDLFRAPHPLISNNSRDKLPPLTDAYALIPYDPLVNHPRLSTYIRLVSSSRSPPVCPRSSRMPQSHDAPSSSFDSPTAPPTSSLGHDRSAQPTRSAPPRLPKSQLCIACRRVLRALRGGADGDRPDVCMKAHEERDDVMGASDGSGHENTQRENELRMRDTIGAASEDERCDEASEAGREDDSCSVESASEAAGCSCPCKAACSGGRGGAQSDLSACRGPLDVTVRMDHPSRCGCDGPSAAHYKVWGRPDADTERVAQGSIRGAGRMRYRRPLDCTCKQSLRDASPDVPSRSKSGRVREDVVMQRAPQPVMARKRRSSPIRLSGLRAVAVRDHSGAGGSTSAPLDSAGQMDANAGFSERYLTAAANARVQLAGVAPKAKLLSSK